MSHLRLTLHYLLTAISSPLRSFRELAAERDHIAVGIVSLLLLGGLYTLTVAGLALVDARVMLEPWLRIPSGEYYYWETFFTLPVYFCGTVMAAGVAQLLARAMSGRGSFEQTFAVFALASTLPWYITWLVESVGTLLILGGVMSHADWIAMTAEPGFWNIFMNAYQLLALIWFVVLIPLAVAAVHGLRPVKAIMSGVPATLLFAVLMIIFIR